MEYRPTKYIDKKLKQELLEIVYIFHVSVEKNNFASTSDMWQSKILLTIDERGSEIATTSVFDCQLSPVGQPMAIGNSVSNYFGIGSSITLTFLIATYQV